jgi:hypothetical protein
MTSRPGRALRAFGHSVAESADRIWYSRPGLLMLGYLILSLAGAVLAPHGTARAAGQNTAGLDSWPTLIWCWRVARGGRWSRILLALASIATIGSATAHLATWWDLQHAGALVIGLAQLALVLSPAAYLATRQDMAWKFRTTGRWLVPVAGGGRPMPWAEPARAALTLRLRPPWWLPLAAMLAGLLLALAWTQHPSFGVVLPHCPHGHLPRASTPPGRCSLSGMGYPLPVRLFTPSAHWHAGVAFARDYVEWALVSLEVLLAARLWWNSRPDYLPAAPPLASAQPAA